MRPSNPRSAGARSNRRAAGRSPCACVVAHLRRGVNQRASFSSSGSMVISSRQPLGMEAEHDGGGEGPGLGGMVAAPRRPRCRLPPSPRAAPLPPGSRPAPRSRPASSTSSTFGKRWEWPSRQASLAHHQHDHGRVGAREMLRAAARADHDVAGAARLAARAADAAEAVLGAPVHQAAGMGEDAGLARRQQAGDLAQVGEAAHARPAAAAAGRRRRSNPPRRPAGRPTGRGRPRGRRPCAPPRPRRRSAARLRGGLPARPSSGCARARPGRTACRDRPARRR